MKLKPIIILFALFICSIAFAEKGAEPLLKITAEADKNQIEIGDWIEFDVRAQNISGKEVVFPKKIKTLGEFSVIGLEPIMAGWPKPQVTGQAYVLSIYTTGTHIIPPVEVKYRSSGEDEWRSAESPQVPIEVKSVLTGNDTDIKDLKGLIGIGRGGFLVFLTLVIILAATAFFLSSWLKKRGQALAREKTERSAYEIAFEELKKLKVMDLPGKGLVKEYYFLLSNIARHYLENRFSYRAPEMTTEEFLEAIKRSKELTEEHKDLLKDFLSRCDMVKFAKYGPTPLEILDSYKSAERLVEQTKEEEGEG